MRKTDWADLADLEGGFYFLSYQQYKEKFETHQKPFYYFD